MRAELPERFARFAELREDFLADYRYNTARAYWGDLEHLNDWCMQRGLDILELSGADLKKYLAWMRRRGYSGGTVRRRRGTYRAFRTNGHVTSELKELSLVSDVRDVRSPRMCKADELKAAE